MAVRWPRSRRLILVLIALVFALLVFPHVKAAYHLWRSRAALARYHPDSASGHLAACLVLWPDNAEARLLASRAARQTGEFEEAARHLHTAQRLLGGSSPRTALEWALLQAAAGNPREVEEYLQRRAEREADLAPLVWEALIEGHIRVYRILDALALATHWLDLDPNNVRALELRGLAYQQGLSAHKGTEDLSRAIALDPARDAARWRLVLGLLDTGSYDETLVHLRVLEKKRPNYPDVQVRIARCHNLLGRGEEARRVLDAVLADHPEHGLALRTRGQFALADLEPARAEEWLRRAEKVWPADYQVHWLLLQSLQQQKKTVEAKAQLRKTEQMKERAERVGELSGPFHKYV